MSDIDERGTSASADTKPFLVGPCTAAIALVPAARPTLAIRRFETVATALVLDRFQPEAGLKDRPSERSGSARKRVFQEQPGYFPMLQVMRSLVLDAIAGFVTT